MNEPDLITRLRGWPNLPGLNLDKDLMNEAAAEVERLNGRLEFVRQSWERELAAERELHTAELERLRALLEAAVDDGLAVQGAAPAQQAEPALAVQWEAEQAAKSPRQPQSLTVGEREKPLAWCALSIGGQTIAYFDGKPMIMPGPVGNEIHDTPLYTRAKPAAQAEPVAWQSRFASEGDNAWRPCSRQHHELVQADPDGWKDYQTRALCVASQPAAQGVEDEQAAFEAWARRDCYHLKRSDAAPERYHAWLTNALWNGWQARAAFGNAAGA